MNLSDLETRIFNTMGWSDTTLIRDYMRQEVRDSINEAYEDIISHLEPYAWFLVREGSFATVDGTSVYTMDDRARKVLGFFTRDERARPIPYLDPFEIDFWGLRNSASTSSYAHQITWYEDTTTAGSEGAAGATTGATVSNASTALTKGSSSTPFASADVGKLIRLNGEVDIEISAVGGDDALTLAVPYVGKLSGETVANTPGSLTAVKWEISPPGRKRIEIMPTPGEVETIYYYHEYQPTPLLTSTDVPILPPRYHKLIYLRAASRMFLLNERSDRGLEYSKMFHSGLRELIEENRAAVAKKGRTMYLANSQMGSFMRPHKRDQDFRYSV